ncbi:hypothetical protein [Saccharibacillus alkalitolerans]|uniref:Uncharacterized protein n=1 Tax=Saccharibacillus alkalitolerans TaxID=2705290 RepID=A0ABX0F9I1_9BACL|nr:hypothetical protein [Saccharibacillus alkalitolerans]NGZ74667.1 hypothetical protein [Saccharibacillus alkalitolerans]
MEDLDTQNAASAEKSFRIALDKLDRQLTLQYHAIAELMKYIEELG